MNSFNKELLNPVIQDFIINFSDEISRLAFSGSPFNHITVQELIQQIEGRRRTAKKLPSWYKTPDIFYPPKLNLEQSSSEQTAQYKASLVTGDRMADLTGGLGVDTYYFSKQFKEVYYFEHHSDLAAITRHNLNKLGTDNVHTSTTNGIESIADHYYDVIYLDPARRDASANRVVSLHDYQPAVLEHLPYLLDRCDQLVIKTSPMLDISLGMKELMYVNALHIVAVNNEVKELLWILPNNDTETTTLTTVNITPNSTQKVRFDWGVDEVEMSYGPPSSYLYEPNAAIMKAGTLNNMAVRYQITKLHAHSHLFTSTELIKSFPGRTFVIQECFPYKKSTMKSHLSKTKAHITTRNFPETVAQLRKRWKITEGGDRYLFFTTTYDSQKVVLDCRKIST